MGWRDVYEVHPAADVFPMMSDEELAELGMDIEENGQRESIKLLFTAKAVPVPEYGPDVTTAASASRWPQQA